MRISLGNFGNVTPGVTPAADTSSIGAAVEHLGDVGVNIAENMRARNVVQARGKAANAVLDHELAVKTTAEAINDKVATGELDYNAARKTYDDEIAKIPRPTIDYLDPTGADALDRGIKRSAFSGGAYVDKAVDVARRRDFQSQFTAGLDKLGKLSGMPDANIEDINTRAAAFGPLAQAAGIPKDEADKAIQEFKDRNWLNNATQRAAESRESIDGLRALEHDLVDANGFYAGKLDTDKRNAVLTSVLTRRDVLENRLRITADKREARAERAVGSIDRQIATGVPATPEMWSTWAQTVHGTSFDEEFKQLAAEERQVQTVLRSPVANQVAYVQQEEAKLLQGGGSVRDAANLARLKEAVKVNVNLMQQAPLIFNAQRTGQETPALDVSALGEEGGGATLAAQFHDRAVTLAAMRKQYGDQVQNRPLLPQEAQVLATALNKASPRQAVQMFAELRNATGDDRVYAAAMQQIAPDSPVKSLAGLLASKQRSLTLERNWVRDDVLASSQDVSATMLEGESILNRTKADKTEDGRSQAKLFLPETKSLQSEFQSNVGGAFAGRPGAAEVAFQAVQSYYVGKAAQTGRLAANGQDIDAKLVRESIRATLGDVVDYNGNGEVFAPWGMGASQFRNTVDASVGAEFKRRGMPVPAPGQVSMFGLRNQGENTYYLVSGRNFVYDPKGQPIVIDITSPGGR